MFESRIDWSRDRRAVDAHFGALSPLDLSSRFGRPVRPEILRGYLDELERTRAVAFGVFASDGELVAFAHFALSAKELEVGLSVLPAYRRRGLASSLLTRAASFARVRGVRELTLHSVSGNHAIVALARRRRMEILRTGSETDSSLRLRAPTALDFWHETLFEHTNAWHSVMRHWQALARRWAGQLPVPKPGGLWKNDHQVRRHD